MKTRTFEVPQDQVRDFAEIIEENDLNNTIKGITEDDDILIAIHYEPDERAVVYELMEILDPDEED